MCRSPGSETSCCFCEQSEEVGSGCLRQFRDALAAKIGDYDAMADLDSFALDLEAATEETIATAPVKKKPKAKKKKKAAAASANGAGPVAAEAQS